MGQHRGSTDELDNHTHGSCLTMKGWMDSRGGRSTSAPLVVTPPVRFGGRSAVLNHHARLRRIDLTGGVAPIKAGSQMVPLAFRHSGKAVQAVCFWLARRRA